MTVTVNQGSKALILVAHPRSRSSAFERVFIQNRAHVDTLHEPFGDPYWLGTERQLGRYEDLRHLSGFADATYKSATERISECLKNSESEGKRLFIKEMAFFMFPSQGNPPHLASSFGSLPSEPGNPTLLPRSELAKLQFTFLIRHPYLAVPSYYRLSLPGRKEASQVKSWTASDLGYVELRRLFEYLRVEGLIGQPLTCNPSGKGSPNGRQELDQAGKGNGICVIDSEDLMEHSHKIMSIYCQSNGVPYDQSILSWDSNEDQQRAAAVIDRWGFPVTFHNAVLSSKGLGAKRHHEDCEQMYQKWIEEFGVDGANEIRVAADMQMEHYNYLRQFVLRV